MKKILIFIVLSLFCFPLFADVVIDSSNYQITSDVVWSGNVTVEHDVEVTATLTIEPGTIVSLGSENITSSNFNNNAKFIKVEGNGRIVAIGGNTIVDIIRFKCLNERIDYYWGGIVIKNTTQRSEFVNCTVEHASYRTDIYEAPNQATMNIINSEFRIENSLFYYSDKNSIFLENNNGSNNIFKNNIVKGSIGANGITVVNSSGFDIEESIFELNKNSVVINSSGVDVINCSIKDYEQYGIYCSDVQNIQIDNNIIYQLYTGREFRDAKTGVVLNGNSYPVIKNNIIYNNSKGIAVQPFLGMNPSSKVIIHNNIIRNNEINVSLANNVLLLNNILYNHEGYGADGSGYEIFAMPNTDAEVYNTIVKTSIPNRCVKKIGTSEIDFYNSNISDTEMIANYTIAYSRTNINGDEINYLRDINNNFSMDPDFVTIPNNLNLRVNSPCFDMGRSFLVDGTDISSILGYSFINNEYDLGVYEREDEPLPVPHDKPLLVNSIENIVSYEDFGTISIDLSEHFFDNNGLPLYYFVNYDATSTEFNIENLGTFDTIGYTLSGNILTINSEENKNFTGLAKTIQIYAVNDFVGNLEYNDYVETVFTISMGAVNDAPYFDNIDDVSYSEDTVGQSKSIAITGVTDGDLEIDQTLVYNISQDNTNVIENISVDTSTNILSFDIKENTAGITEITVVLKDNGGTGIFTDNYGNSMEAFDEYERTFTVEVFNINDKPDFALTNNAVTVDEDSGIYSANIISSVNLGNQENSGEFYEQEIEEYILSGIPSGLFSSISLDNSGNLSFVPADNAWGIANFKISLKDNGGTLSGGIDVSDEKDFTITILPVNDQFICDSEDETIFHIVGTMVPTENVSVDQSNIEDRFNDDIDVDGYNGSILSNPYVYNPSITYQWYIADDNIGTGETIIPGATNTILQLENGWVNKFLKCRITISENGFPSGSADLKTYNKSTYWRKVGNSVPTISSPVVFDYIILENELKEIELLAKDIDGHDLSWNLSSVTTVDGVPFSGTCELQDVRGGYDYTSESKKKLVFHSNIDVIGNYSVTVTVSDPYLATDQIVINYEVKELNSAPNLITTLDPINIDEDIVSYTFNILYDDGNSESIQNVTLEIESQDTDIMSDSNIFISPVSVPTSNNGQYETQISFVPNANANGQVKLNFVLVDDGGTIFPDDNNQSVYEMTVNIAQVWDTPVLTPESTSIIGNEDESFSKDLSLYITDVDLDTTVNKDELDKITYSCITSEYGTTNTLGSEHISAVLNGSILEFSSLENWYGTEIIQIKYEDKNGFFVTNNLNITINPINDAPVCTINPVVSGVLYVYNDLSVSLGTWNDDLDQNMGESTNISYEYQWEMSEDNVVFSNILNENNMILQTNDVVYVGKYIRCKIIASDDGFPDPGVSSLAYSNTVMMESFPGYFVYNSTNYNPGSSISLSTDEDIAITVNSLKYVDPIVASYNWSISDAEHCVVVLEDLSDNEKRIIYTPEENYSGVESQFIVNVEADGVIKNLIFNVNINPINDIPINLTLPVISGIPSVGSTLEVSNGDWDDDSALSFIYQWKYWDGTNWIDIVGEQNSTYTVNSSDIDKQITCTVTASDEDYSVEVTASSVLISIGIPIIGYNGNIYSLDVQLDEDKLEDVDIVSNFNINNYESTHNYSWSITSLNNYSVVSENGNSDESYSVTLTPDDNYNGTAGYLITLTDNTMSQSSSILFNINIIAVNDAPVFVGLPSVFNGTEDTLLSIDLTGYASDVDAGSSLSINVASTEHLTVSNLSGLTFDIIPDENWNGLEQLTIELTDGIIVSPVVTVVDVNVSAVNDAPEAVSSDVNITIQEDSYIDYNISGLFSDIDLDTILNNNLISPEVLTYQCVTSNYGGSNILGTEHVVAVMNGSVVNLTPMQNWFGEETIVFRAIDNEGLFVDKAVILTVENINDTPHFVNVETEIQSNEDSVIILDFNGKIVDEDNNYIINDELILSAVNTAHLEVVSVTDYVVVVKPTKDWNGSEVMTFTINDQQRRATSSLDISFEILPVEDSPIATEENMDTTMNEDTLDSSLNCENIFYDADTVLELNTVVTDFLTYQCMTSNYGEDNQQGSEHISVVIDETTVTLTPMENWFGVESIVLRATDVSGNYAEKNITIFVENVNDAPVLSFPSEFSFNEDTILSVNATDYISDIDNNLSELTLSWESISNSEISISQNNLQLSITNENENWNGSEVVTFIVSDGVENVSQPVTINIISVNDTPSITLPQEGFDFDEDQSLSINFVSYISDIEQSVEELTITNSGNTNININIVGTVVNFSSVENWFGSENITFTVNDNQRRLIASDEVIVTVNPINDVPVVTNEINSITMNENSVDTSINLNNVFYDVDVATGDNLAFSYSGNTNITVAITNAEVSLTPNTDWYGIETITFTATDDAGELVSTSVEVTVENVSDIPEIQPISNQYIWNVANVDSIFRYNVEFYGLPMPTLSLEQSPEGMTIDETTGIIEWLPMAEQTGKNVVVVKADNGILPYDRETFEIYVVNKNEIVNDVYSTTLSLNEIKITWGTQSNPVWVVGYKVYYSEKYDEDWALLGETNVSTHEFVHTNLVKGKNYFYYVTAILEVNNLPRVESDMSEIQSSYVMTDEEIAIGYDDGTNEDFIPHVENDGDIAPFDINLEEYAVDFSFKDVRSPKSSTKLTHIFYYVTKKNTSGIELKVYGYGDNPETDLKTYTIASNLIHKGWNDFLIPEADRPSLIGKNFFVAVKNLTDPIKIGVDTNGTNFEKSIILIDGAWEQFNRGNIQIRAILEGRPISELILSDNSVAFSQVYVGQDSNTRKITLTNNGNVDLNINDLTVNNQFYIRLDNDEEWEQSVNAFTIKSLETKDLFVKFHPVKFEDYSTKITISSNDPMGDQEISLKGTTKQLIPNTFTPNSDGKNDEFRMGPFTSDSGKDAELIIYDLQGKEVYSVKGKANSILAWNGDGAERDTYLYIYILDGENYRKGKVYLVK